MLFKNPTYLGLDTDRVRLYELLLGLRLGLSFSFLGGGDSSSEEAEEDVMVLLRRGVALDGEKVNVVDCYEVDESYFTMGVWQGVAKLAMDSLKLHLDSP
jgi:hypothetical protein